MNERKNNEVSVWIPIIAIVFLVFTMCNQTKLTNKLFNKNDNTTNTR